MIPQYQKLQQLSVFGDLLQDPVVHAFKRLLKKSSGKRAAAFCRLLYDAHTDNWSAYLKEAVLSLENCLIYYVFAQKPIPENMRLAALSELSALEEISAITPEQLDLLGEYFWQAEKTDLIDDYFDRLAHIDQYGFGDFAKYHMFRLDTADGAVRLQPVPYPDPVTFNDLYGYELQHEMVIENTRFLLDGYTASNVLLYGDAGTGKSATVKAIANTFHEQGLRLIELQKKQLHFLPQLLDELSVNPLKFILFIDDLSFQDSDDDFSALKAVLEGSVSVRSHNTVIYATSNRRHIVKETFQAREGDEVHRNDTMQETISLSERFGIKVNFEKPKKDVYQAIVKALADQYGLDLSERDLALKAEQFALRKAGRSARAARQLVEQLSARRLKEEDENADIG